MNKNAWERTVGALKVAAVQQSPAPKRRDSGLKKLCTALKEELAGKLVDIGTGVEKVATGVDKVASSVAE
eukprot:gene17034-20254_t